MKYTLIILAFVGTISTYSCRKKTPVHYTIDSFLLKNFDFKPGTYWVFKDSLSSDEDSFTVDSRTFFSQKIGDNQYIDGINTDVFQYYKSNLVGRWYATISGGSIQMK